MKAAKMASPTDPQPNTFTQASSDDVASALTTDLVNELLTLTTPLTIAANRSAPDRWYLPARTHRSIKGVMTHMAAIPATRTQATSLASLEMRCRRSSALSAARRRGTRV